MIEQFSQRWCFSQGLDPFLEENTDQNMFIQTYVLLMYSYVSDVVVVSLSYQVLFSSSKD